MGIDGPIPFPYQRILRRKSENANSPFEGYQVGQSLTTYPDECNPCWRHVTFLRLTSSEQSTLLIMIHPESIQIHEGVCFVIFAYDVGISINLEEAENRTTATKERGRIKRKRPTPEYFDYHPPPLRITQELKSVTVGSHQTLTTTETILYDFGGIMVIYRIPLRGDLSSLRSLSEALYEHAGLLESSRAHAQGLLHTLGDAVEKANLSPFVEDYAIFHLSSVQPWMNPSELIESQKPLIAQILRSETQTLSGQEVHDATNAQISWGTQDITVIDWNAALMLGQEMDDVQAVLEFLNVELVERRFLDHQLDQALDEGYNALMKRRWSKFRWPGSLDSKLRHIAGLQVDSAILFERVTNTLKLLGDQYLARVYRLGSQRFHLQGWDTSIVRKLETLDNLYGKMSDNRSNRRMEILEWIIIILIAISIILPFIPGFPGY